MLAPQEHVEENLFIRKQEEEQLEQIRKQMEDRRRLRQQLWDEVRLENAMEDLKFILKDEQVSPEAMKKLAEWKADSF